MVSRKDVDFLLLFSALPFSKEEEASAEDSGWWWIFPCFYGLNHTFLLLVHSFFSLFFWINDAFIFLIHLTGWRNGCYFDPWTCAWWVWWQDARDMEPYGKSLLIEKLAWAKTRAEYAGISNTSLITRGGKILHHRNRGSNYLVTLTNFSPVMSPI